MNDKGRLYPVTSEEVQHGILLPLTYLSGNLNQRLVGPSYIERIRSSRVQRSKRRTQLDQLQVVPRSTQLNKYKITESAASEHNAIEVNVVDSNIN